MPKPSLPSGSLWIPSLPLGFLQVSVEVVGRERGGKRYSAGARVVSKAYPEERVGVFARKGDAVTVVEYSELPPSEAASKDSGT